MCAQLFLSNHIKCVPNSHRVSSATVSSRRLRRRRVSSKNGGISRRVLRRGYRKSSHRAKRLRSKRRERVSHRFDLKRWGGEDCNQNKDSDDKTLHKNFLCGGSSMQGWPTHMEDFYYANIITIGPNREKVNLVAVFDGHGGDQTATNVALRIKDKMEDKLKECDNMDANTIGSLMADGFMELDKELYELDHDNDSGSTAIVAIITDTDIIVANVGDCRAILVREDLSITLMSNDHNTKSESEQKRIMTSTSPEVLKIQRTDTTIYNINSSSEELPAYRVTGDTYKLTNSNSKQKYHMNHHLWEIVNKSTDKTDWRIGGRLAPSRGFGNFTSKIKKDVREMEKNQALTAYPEIITENYKDKPFEFLILCSDGIWDGMKNYDVAFFVTTQIKEQLGQLGQLGQFQCSKVCEELLRIRLWGGLQYNNKNDDNMTAVMLLNPVSYNISNDGTPDTNPMIPSLLRRVLAAAVKIQSFLRMKIAKNNVTNMLHRSGDGGGAGE